MVDIFQKHVLVVGGGKVAFRKAQKILEFGGNLTILSPEIIDDFKILKELYKERLNLIYDIYNKTYIEGCFLVIGATSLRAINSQIGEDCKNLNILVNLVDSKDESDFITPAVINNDNLTISISTMGSFPYLSKKIRRDMGEQYGKFNKEYMDVLEEIRHFILDEDSKNIGNTMDMVLSLDLSELKNLLKSYKNDL
jgi:siroheme synthase-like protein